MGTFSLQEYSAFPFLSTCGESHSITPCIGGSYYRNRDATNGYTDIMGESYNGYLCCPCLGFVASFA